MQLDLFEQCPHPKPTKRNKRRDVHQEAKEILEHAGISEWPKELKALIAALLMREYFPESHKLMIQMLQTTSITTTNQIIGVLNG